MWQSEDDIINDLAALNDFGEPGNTEPYKILLSVGRGSKAKNKSQPLKMLDPRTGEEIEVSNNCLTVEDMLYRGLGRGAELASSDYSLLRRQLRMARPLGSSDELIESFYKNRASRKVESSFRNIQPEKLPEEKVAAPTISRVKGVRNSNSVKNALMAGLLKAQQLPGTDAETGKSNATGEPEALRGGGRDRDGRNGEAAACDSHSDTSFSEDATSGSLCDSKASSGVEMKGSGDESFKSGSIDIIDFNSDLSSDDESFVYAKCDDKEKVRNVLNSEETDEAKEANERNEIYRKLGERINNMKNSYEERSRRPKKKNQFFFQGHKDGAWASQSEPNLKPFSEGFVYDESNFPPLV